MSTAQAPARLILSGEHAVVYGQPALAMAIDKFAKTTVIERPGTEAIFFSSFSTELLQYAFRHIWGLLQAGHLRHPRENGDLKNSYKSMDSRLRGNDEQCKNSACNSSICDHFDLKFAHGLEIRTQSNIPIGCGFGSSAAVIISFLHAMVNFFALKLSIAEYLTLGKEIENLPHGRSSGLDLYLAIHGGCVRFAGQKTIVRSIPDLPMYLVNSGTPQTNTGECVSFAAKYFYSSNSLAQDFGAVTDALDKALQANNLSAIKECIRANHKLLIHIGVVPEKVQDFIAQIEALGGAAKICGAGACAGQNAGAVLLVTETDVSDIIKDYGYEIFPVKGNTCGMQII